MLRFVEEIKEKSVGLRNDITSFYDQSKNYLKDIKSNHETSNDLRTKIQKNFEDSNGIKEQVKEIADLLTRIQALVTPFRRELKCFHLIINYGKLYLVYQ